MTRQHYFIQGHKKGGSISVAHYTSLELAIEAFKKKAPRFKGYGFVYLVPCIEIAPGLWTQKQDGIGDQIASFKDIKSLEELVA